MKVHRNMVCEYLSNPSDLSKSLYYKIGMKNGKCYKVGLHLPRVEHLPHVEWFLWRFMMTHVHYLGLSTLNLKDTPAKWNIL